MSEHRKYTETNEIAPFSAVVTVPGELVSAAVYEAVCGAWWLGGRIGDAARRLRGR